jgi:hypothetical protein
MTPARWGRHVPRSTLEEELKARVLRSIGASASPLLLVTGTGGFGKTWLVQSLGLDGDVLKHFDGGVLWAQLSEERTLLRATAELDSLVRHLGGQPDASNDPRMLARRLGELTGGLPTLLVVDDAWTPGHVEPFIDSLPSSCFRIVTSRSRKVVPPGVEAVRVDRMLPAEAATLLRGSLPLSDEDLSPILDVCDDWPLVLAIVGGHLQRMVDHGASPEDAVALVLDDLRRRGITAFDPDRGNGSANPRRRTVEATMESSLQLLRDTDPAAVDRYL